MAFRRFTAVLAAVALFAASATPSAGQATAALLQRAAAEFQPIKQASSLGAEDMVVTHLLHLAGIDMAQLVGADHRAQAERRGHAPHAAGAAVGRCRVGHVGLCRWQQPAAGQRLHDADGPMPS